MSSRKIKNIKKYAYSQESVLSRLYIELRKI